MHNMQNHFKTGLYGNRLILPGPSHQHHESDSSYDSDQDAPVVEKNEENLQLVESVEPGELTPDKWVALYYQSTTTKSSAK